MDELMVQNHLRGMAGIGQIATRPELPIVDPGGPGASTTGPEGSNFTELLSESINKVNDRMLGADKKAQELVTGQSTDLQGTLLAMQKADISFRLLMSVRTKVIRAYEEVMRMQA